jgi:hypothetical protein
MSRAERELLDNRLGFRRTLRRVEAQNRARYDCCPCWTCRLAQRISADSVEGWDEMLLELVPASITQELQALLPQG